MKSIGLLSTVLLLQLLTVVLGLCPGQTLVKKTILRTVSEPAGRFQVVRLIVKDRQNTANLLAPTDADVREAGRAMKYFKGANGQCQIRNNKAKRGTTEVLCDNVRLDRQSSFDQNRVAFKNFQIQLNDNARAVNGKSSIAHLNIQQNLDANGSPTPGVQTDKELINSGLTASLSSRSTVWIYEEKIPVRGQPTCKFTA